MVGSSQVKLIAEKCWQGQTLEEFTSQLLLSEEERAKTLAIFVYEELTMQQVCMCMLHPESPLLSTSVPQAS